MLGSSPASLPVPDGSLNVSSFACGSHNSRVTDSISIPRKVTTVKAPSSLSGAIGSPSSAHSGTTTSRALLHAADVGEAQKKKSSR